MKEKRIAGPQLPWKLMADAVGNPADTGTAQLRQACAASVQIHGWINGCDCVMF